jgi:hypothetical protein
MNTQSAIPCLLASLALVGCQDKPNQSPARAVLKSDSPVQDAVASASVVTDVDGNRYSTVKIGTQIWMKENLKTIHYRNGDPIPKVTDNIQWDGLATGAYCDYDNQVTCAGTHRIPLRAHCIDYGRRIDLLTGRHHPRATQHISGH